MNANSVRRWLTGICMVVPVGLAFCSSNAIAQEADLHTEFSRFSELYRLPQEYRFQLFKGINRAKAAGKMTDAQYQCIAEQFSLEYLDKMMRSDYEARFKDDVELLKQANVFYAMPVGQHIRDWDLANQEGSLKATAEGTKYVWKPAYLYLTNEDRAQLPAWSKMNSEIESLVAGFPASKRPPPDPAKLAEMLSVLQGCGLRKANSQEQDNPAGVPTR